MTNTINNRKRLLANNANARRARRSSTVNSRSKQRALYEAKKNMYNRIMREITPIIESELKKNGNQLPVNELFGFGGGSAKEPQQKLTAEFIKEASNDELAAALAENMNYWMAKGKENVDLALQDSIAAIHAACESSKEVAQKVCTAVGAAIKNALTGAKDLAIDGVRGLGRLILMGVAMLVKLANNGIDFAKNTLPAVYNMIVNYLKQVYQSLKDKTNENGGRLAEKLKVFYKVAVAAITLVANKVSGAAEVFGKWISDVCNDAKENVLIALYTVRTWFAVKAKAVADYVSETAGSIKQAVVEAWNKLDKSARKMWKEATEKILGWINDVKVSLANLKQKISASVTAAGDKIVAGRDKVLVSGINKAVNILKNRYSEDDMVALVRKAYNEGIEFEIDGTCLLNECYYTNTYLKQI